MDLPPVNAMLHLLRIPGKKLFSTTRLAVLLAGTLFAGTFAWFVVPCLFNLLASTISNLWVSVRSSTAPPYLFVAVNFIILTIWKLSENRVIHSDRMPEEENPFNSDVVSLRSQDLVSPLNPQVFRKTSMDDSRKTPSIPTENYILTDSAEEKPSPAPASESSCITTVSEEKSTASSSSDGLNLPDSGLTTTFPKGKEEIVDSLDATWNSITRKIGRWERSPSPPLIAGKQTGRLSEMTVSGDCALSEGKDDMNQLFEDFIKKNYDQFRLRKPG
ncbi:uncharacterized protein LOC110018103 isoform X2 [Phalaenopsis equestris]|uniref:uncharacterized protein LOC110018103 isoform X2 n=1 Tax=Phalaenopsis equestris TaxID=78828 RepID=UPI0009E2A2A9|nr:uncharacterized protein LOC110018103 isoform X2 [Phalaenopsis equestris]